MTPRERMRAFEAGEPTDRVPCAPLVADHAGWFLGVKISDYNRSASVMAESHVALHREVPFDAVCLPGGWKALAEALGATLAFPDDNTPYVTEHPIRGASALGDLEHLAGRGPADPKRGGRLPLHLEALRRVLDAVGDEVQVNVQVGSPLSLAAALVGTEALLKAFYREPGFVDAVLRLATDSVLAYCRAILAEGGLPWTSEPVASGSLLSPEHFARFAAPSLREVQSLLVEKTGRSQLHICGNTRKVWGLMADTGATVLSLDEAVDLAEASTAVGDRVALMGNVAPLTLLHESPGAVRDEARGCLAKAGGNPAGFILSSGCAAAIGTPTENLRALLDAAGEPL